MSQGLRVGLESFALVPGFGEVALEEPDQLTGCLRREVEHSEVVLVIGDDIKPVMSLDQIAGSTQMSVAARMCDRVNAQVTKMMDSEHAEYLDG